MPKMKTHKSAAKRYTFTGSGKVKYKNKDCGISSQKRPAKERVSFGKPVF